MILFIPAILIAAFIGYYFIIFKPDQDEKNEAKKKRKSIQDSRFSENKYDEIIDDYPTYHRNK